jgi:hypothetical protein
MRTDNPLLMKRVLGYFFISIAVFSGLEACFLLLVAWIASQDPIGSSVMADNAGKCALTSGTMACLGIYILKRRIRLRSSA